MPGAHGVVSECDDSTRVKHNDFQAADEVQLPVTPAGILRCEFGIANHVDSAFISSRYYQCHVIYLVTC
jgi:hypothetical protein